MNADIALTLIAAVPTAPYVDPIKAGILVLMLLGWAAAAQWVDRDTDTVKTRREQWNLIVLSGGTVAWFVLLAVPVWEGGLFALGVAFWLLLAGSSMIAYLIHRNSRVVPDARVLTVGHVKRLIGGDAARKTKDKGLRVRLYDSEGEFVELPTDPEEGLAYNAVQDFLFDVLWHRASEADVLAGKEGYRVVYHVDGVPSEQPDGLDVEEGERIFRFLKKIAGLNVEEIRRPQVGRIQAGLLSEDGDPGHAEVRTSGTTQGERLQLRIAAGPKILRLHELGIPPARMDRIKQILAKSTGLFIISSPPRHGLTTTQYAILRSHDAYINHIHALERHPLTELDNITQVRYEGANTTVNYARMLQTVLRREPDIVLVGECDDRETATIAARAAADDRKIYMAMNARDTFEALSKFLSFVNDNKLAAAALLGVLNQRLVRILCTECREAFKPDSKTLKKLNLPADKIDCFYRPPTEPKLDRRGRPIICSNCQGTGYVGRTGVFELLIVDDAVRKLIEEDAPINRIKAQCRKNKMYYLQEEGLLKVIDSTTSMNEILRCLSAGKKEVAAK